MKDCKIHLYPELTSYISQRLDEIDDIPTGRVHRLRDLSRYVSERTIKLRPSRLTFICTHNSRRSHLAQIWAQTAASFFGVALVQTFSGGSEATVFDSRAVAAIARAGFRVEAKTDEYNPVYEVRSSDGAQAMTCFSKIYDQPPNPTASFCAVMTCAAADTACPVVLGADERLAIFYDDPKDFDGTEHETALYDERCRQIAREMLFGFSMVKSTGNVNPSRTRP